MLFRLITVLNQYQRELAVFFFPFNRNARFVHPKVSVESNWLLCKISELFRESKYHQILFVVEFLVCCDEWCVCSFVKLPLHLGRISYPRPFSTSNNRSLIKADSIINTTLGWFIVLIFYILYTGNVKTSLYWLVHSVLHCGQEFMLKNLCVDVTLIGYCSKSTLDGGGKFIQVTRSEIGVNSWFWQINPKSNIV